MPAIPSHPALLRLSQLQDWRGRRAFDTSISGSIAMLAGNAQRIRQRLGAVAELWQELLPPAIVGNTALVGLRNGVLQVTADSSATSFELDRMLRGGVEGELRKRFRGTLVRIRIRVEPTDKAAAPAGRASSRSRTPTTGAKQRLGNPGRMPRQGRRIG